MTTKNYAGAAGLPANFSGYPPYAFRHFDGFE